MSFFEILKGTAKSFSAFSDKKPEQENKNCPVQIEIVKPIRSHHEQFRDMLNEGRDTDKIKKNRRKLNDVCSGRCFDTDCSSFVRRGGPYRSRSKYQSDFWRF